MKDALIVFVKAPVPGRVKTRLCPPLKPAQAAGLHIALVKDSLASARAIPGARLEVFYEPSPEFPDLRWLGEAIAFRTQRGEDLGRRLDQAFAEVFDRGAAKAVAIGTDCPELGPSILREAFALLNRADVVLGPAADGGYYLIGLKEPASFLFEGVSWSTPSVFRQTRERAELHRLTLAVLPTLSDVDTISDLETLAARGKAPKFTRAALPPSLPAGLGP